MKKEDIWTLRGNVCNAAMRAGELAAMLKAADFILATITDKNIERLDEDVLAEEVGKALYLVDCIREKLVAVLQEK